MLSRYKSALFQHLNAHSGKDVAPWVKAFCHEMFSRPRSARLIYTASVRCRTRIRDRIASRSLQGVGLEIGAQNVPTKVNSHAARTEYIDRLTREQTSVQFGIPLEKLVEVTHLIDGGRLEKFENGSRDYLIANHVLEHFDDPVGAVIEWLRVLAPGGRLFLSLPNFCNNPFDFRRRPPTARHFERDFQDANHRVASARDHYADLIQSIYQFEESDPVIYATADKWVSEGDRNHYHVYDEQAFRDVLRLAGEKSGTGLRVVDYFLIDSAFEYIVVLEKSAEPGTIVWPDPVKSRARAVSLLARQTVADVIRFYAARKQSKSQAATV
jgi:SAM-dependent methyltransferase